jgi:NADPH:quinone reductase-like Zn-dependent oxidoreductase
MRAYQIQTGFGYDNLVCVDLPDPNPGPGEVLVRIRAVSLNYRDHLMISGRYNPRQVLPLVPCSDAAGEVVAVGSGVSRVEPGDRVMPIFAQDWIAGRPTGLRMRSTLGGPRPGVLRELGMFPEHALVRVPAYLSFEQAATLPCAALTAYNALFKYEPLRAGQRVLVLGTGGVSIFALQFAKAAGAEVFLTSGSADKLERAAALGADHVINYTEVLDWGKEVRRASQGEGVDIVVEVGGAGSLANSIRATAAGGLIALVGVLAADTNPPNLTPVFMNGLRVQGLLVGCRDDFEAMNGMLAARQLLPVIDRVFEFDAAQQAFAHLSGQTHLGKVVIRV